MLQQKLRIIKFLTKNSVDAYLYLSQDWSKAPQKFVFEVLKCTEVEGKL